LQNVIESKSKTLLNEQINGVKEDTTTNSNLNIGDNSSSNSCSNSNNTNNIPFDIKLPDGNDYKNKR
jgi:hypothetical protein